MEGLTTEEAESRLRRYGYNEWPGSSARPVWRIAFEVIAEPMFILLIACGLLYVLIGDYREGIVLLSAFFVVMGITFFQYRKTERALEALKAISAPRALVLRSGQVKRIAGRELVPGDVVFLTEGDRIAADGVLMSNTLLMTDESLITGESVPVAKSNTDGSNELYSGTLAVKGQGMMVVTKTGMRAGIGKIAGSLATLRDSQTLLQGEMKVLTRRLAMMGVLISALVATAFYFTRGNIVNAALAGLSSAMAIMPEEFPVVFTVFLALGAWRLSRQNVLTRSAAVIETLGSATVLCCDKTGTITANKMEVVQVYNGQVIIARNEFEKQKQQVQCILEYAALASHDSSADPVDRAILSAAAGVLKMDRPYRQPVKEFPMAQPLMCMGLAYEQGESPNTRMFFKGAPESVLGLCGIAENADIKKVLEEMSGRGYKILGVGWAETRGPIPEKLQDFHCFFEGFLALEDPVRPEVREAVQDCMTAGIRVVMITGDYPATARSIAAEAGLRHEVVVTGNQLQGLSEKELTALAGKADVFARVTPDHKLSIVNALKNAGEVVAMTSDGVNDAPALKAAHIGIAMGNRGTDVAREAADLVLLDDRFESIVSAVKGGRRIYDNLQKAMAYIMAVHIPIIGLTLLPSFNGTLPILLMPLHIVFLELVIDPVCSVAFESEKDEPDIMKRPPRRRGMPFFGLTEMGLSVLNGLLLFLMVMAVYFITLSEGHTDTEVRTIAFSAFVMGNVFLIFSGLSRTYPVVTIFRKVNRAAWLTVLFSLFALVAVIYVPGIRVFFAFSNPGYRHFGLVLLMAALLLFMLEFVKHLRFGAYREKEGGA